MKKIIVTIFAALLLGSCSDSINDLLDELNATVPICVDSSALSGGDGRGWAHAVPTITDALSLVQSGGEIWVKAGTYEITTSILISKSVMIYGGFSGTETRLNQRNSSVYLTTISVTGDGVTAATISVSEGNLVIDGFTIEGVADGASGFDISGSLLIRLTNCIFKNFIGIALNAVNSSLITQGCTFSSNGNAISVTSSNVTISNSSTFANNSANIGGGAIFATGSSIINISDCNFTGNDETNNSVGGGAIYTVDTTIINISNSTFTNNLSPSSGNAGGAICTTDNTVASITNSNFLNNSSTFGDGGAICISGNSTATLSSILFSNNSAANGGAIYSSSNITIKNSIISNNTIYTSTLSSIYGAGIYQNTSGKILIIINSQLTGNIASSADTIRGIGGAIYHTDAACKIYSSTISNNSAENFSSGIVSSSASLDIYNSIIGWNGGYADNKFLYAQNSAIVNAYNTCYENSISLVTGATFNQSVSITSDPLFSNTATNDFTLQSTSPCRNTGDNSFIPSDVTTDLAGNPRVVGGAVDMGAYEWQ